MPPSADHDAESARLLIAGRLVRSVAHNLRQPLMSLEMNLATIRKLTKVVPIDVEQVTEAIEDARVAERRMAMSLQALEDLVIPRRRRDESIDVSDVVRDVAGLVGANMQNSRVRIEADIAPGLPPILGDVAMVREAVLSLVVSAIDQVKVGSAHPGAPAHESARHLPIRIVAKRDGTSHVAAIVEYARADGRGESVEAPSWDTSIARAVVALHHGFLAIEMDTISSRATTRWPINTS